MSHIFTFRPIHRKINPHEPLPYNDDIIHDIMSKYDFEFNTTQGEEGVDVIGLNDLLPDEVLDDFNESSAEPETSEQARTSEPRTQNIRPLPDEVLGSAELRTSEPKTSPERARVYIHANFMTALRSVMSQYDCTCASLQADMADFPVREIVAKHIIITDNVLARPVSQDQYNRYQSIVEHVDGNADGHFPSDMLSFIAASIEMKDLKADDNHLMSTVTAIVSRSYVSAKAKYLRNGSELELHKFKCLLTDDPFHSRVPADIRESLTGPMYHVFPKLRAYLRELEARLVRRVAHQAQLRLTLHSVNQRLRVLNRTV